jgi:hypothetical protein
MITDASREFKGSSMIDNLTISWHVILYPLAALAYFASMLSGLDKTHKHER